MGGEASAGFAGVPEAQDDDGLLLDGVAEFVVADDEAADFVGGEFFEGFTEAGVGEEAYGGAGEGLYCASGGGRLTGARKSWRRARSERARVVQRRRVSGAGAVRGRCRGCRPRRGRIGGR